MPSLGTRLRTQAPAQPRILSPRLSEAAAQPGVLCKPILKLPTAACSPQSPQSGFPASSPSHHRLKGRLKAACNLSTDVSVSVRTSTLLSFVNSALTSRCIAKQRARHPAHSSVCRCPTDFAKRPGAAPCTSVRLWNGVHLFGSTWSTS